jgi:integrase/recombinase XerC
MKSEFSEALPSKRIARLEASLDAKIERYFDTLDTDPDVLKRLLADKRSENTRRAYERDVNDFLVTMTGMPALPDNVLEFLHLEERQAVSVVLKYKADRQGVEGGHGQSATGGCQKSGGNGP